MMKLQCAMKEFFRWLTRGRAIGSMDHRRPCFQLKMKCLQSALVGIIDRTSLNVREGGRDTGPSPNRQMSDEFWIQRSIE